MAVLVKAVVHRGHCCSQVQRHLGCPWHQSLKGYHFSFIIIHNYENCGIKVDQALHAQIPVSWADSMCWVDDKFEKATEDAYNEVGRPALLMTIGWSVFSSMAQLITLEEETPANN